MIEIIVDYLRSKFGRDKVNYYQPMIYVNHGSITISIVVYSEYIVASGFYKFYYNDPLFFDKIVNYIMSYGKMAR